MPTETLEQPESPPQTAFVPIAVETLMPSAPRMALICICGNPAARVTCSIAVADIRSRRTILAGSSNKMFTPCISCSTTATPTPNT